MVINTAALLGADERLAGLEPGTCVDCVISCDDLWDGRDEVERVSVEGDPVFAADGPYLSA